MSTNGVNVEDAEMAECDGEKVVTMMDVLQEQQEFEEDANAVLGASDDKNCTYSKGYIKRQALYACLTCCSEAKEDPSKRAGVCLACSLTCHENHDLIELYTKRNFCCDCGNAKFNHQCQYTPKIKDLNNENKYNQNFSGLYCTCHRPYPDPDGVEEEMIQCIICEDWLHESHLEATVPSSDAYAEMICKGCMEKNGFLHDYSRYAVNGDDVNINDSDISICNGDTSKLNGIDEAKKELANGKEVPNMTVEKSEDGGEEVIGDSNGKLTGNAVSVESENHSLANDEQIEPKVIDSECSNVNELEECEEKPKESTEETDVENKAKEQNTTLSEGIEKVEDAEGTNAEQDLEEQNITSTESTEKVEDASKLTETGNKEQLSVDNSDVASIDTENTTNVSANDAQSETNNEPMQLQESSVSTKLTGESDTNNEGAADQINKDEKEPNTNKTEIEANKEDTNGIPNEKPVKTQENQKDSAESNVNDSNENEMDTNKEDANGISNDQLVKSQDNQKDSAESNETEMEIKTEDTKRIHNDQPVNSQENQKDTAELNVNDSIERDTEMDESIKVEVNTLTTEDQSKENKRKLSTEDTDDAVDATSVKKPKLEGSKCTRPRNERKVFKGATFWPYNFRQKLCTCNECIVMYQDLSVLFLIDPEDTVSAYEMLGKERTDGIASTQYEKGLEALSSLGRIQQINAMTEYNKMRDKLLDFLKSFKDRKEVVKEDDIKSFFAGMKPKREPDGVYFCK